jgi:hypothetical protein
MLFFGVVLTVIGTTVVIMVMRTCNLALHWQAICRGLHRGLNRAVIDIMYAVQMHKSRTKKPLETDFSVYANGFGKGFVQYFFCTMQELG